MNSFHSSRYKGNKMGSKDETVLLITDQDNPAVSEIDLNSPTSVGGPESSTNQGPTASVSQIHSANRPPPGIPAPQVAPSASLPRRDLSNPSENKDFAFIKIIARITLQLVRKFWHVSSAGFLAFFLLYWLFGGILAFLVVIFGITGILYHASDRFLYHPNQPETARVFVPAPSIVGLPFESVYITTRDKVRLHGFFIKQSTPEKTAAAATVIFLHGNAGNIGHRLVNVKSLYLQLGVNVFLLEYRGFGHSDGSPGEDGLYLDAQAGLDYLTGGGRGSTPPRSDIDPSKVIVFGRSLGGAVAVELSSKQENRDKIAAVILENTFTSIPEVAKSLFDVKLVRCLPVWCYKNKYQSRKKSCKLSAPALFISGQADALIPPKMMTELFMGCGSEKKRLARFPGGSHNETWTCSHYSQTLKYFLTEVAKLSLDGSGLPAKPSTPPPVLVSDTTSLI